MHTEIEAKFLAIDHEMMRQKLQESGAVLEKPMRLMRRTVFDDIPGDQSYLRVRDEGDKITMTHKQFVGRGIDGANEIETTVGNYDTAIHLIKALGIQVGSEQESRRETWRLDECEVELDEWPWLKPYMEIEGPSENAIKAVAAKLSMKWEDAIFGSVTRAYRTEYNIPDDISIGACPRIAFDQSVPRWLAVLKR